MNRNLYALIFCFAFGLSACAQQGAPENSTPTNSATGNPASASAQATATQIVRHEALPTEIARGAAAEAIVRLSIADGYHINANPPTYPYLKATQLDIASANNITVAGKPVYPPAQSVKFSFDPKPLDVYEGAVEIKVPLRASDTAAQGSFSLAGKLQVQPCDDQQCYAPRTIDVSIPVTIK